ncbi:primosomal protein N' [Hylemonella gracilis]|uniref:Replication restart protein PriA n=1 Tax=Hylemonella gracilis TaxID=80880 RepID=A0A4P6UJ31_9BURK|nr:primosomal protein N' [Hylemonella gracilis]QBK04065.1 primosomal protein N' [Hylemonella gracilis]
MAHPLPILVPTPAHSAIHLSGGTLTWLSEQALVPGTLVRVPLGRRVLLGIVWDSTTAAADTPAIDADKLRPIAEALTALPPLSESWRRLVDFTARYYQRSAGEVALAALPPALRELSGEQLARRLKKQRRTSLKAPDPSAPIGPLPTLTAEQATALEALAKHDASAPFLLFGATGSGKTEVYLRAVQDLLARDPQAQALVMVPEINLTPQLEARFIARFGAARVVSLHSGMTNPQRLRSWLAAHGDLVSDGESDNHDRGTVVSPVRIVLGTRMAVFASLPRLQLIVVDEEHDPSYKQQEGARYSARDLAVYRGRLENAQVILGSATPSLESWHHSRPADDGGRYVRLAMPSRVGATDQPDAPGGGLPLVRRVDMRHQPKGAVFSPPLLAAMRERIARGEQCLVFLNRRGYAPVLHCAECEWKSECPHCSAYRVFHKIDRTLRCHHCGYTERVPRACPACGSPDIRPIGRGTEQIEEQLAQLLADVQRPAGTPAGTEATAAEAGPVRIARIDADTTRHKGELEAQLAQVHQGEVDVLVGTQMIAKGHDFRNITLVAVINPDTALFSSDFRAPERLFSLLMQVAGRAGRDTEAQARAGRPSEVWVQTEQPAHPLYETLKQHDYPAFAAQQLQEREQAGLPPFSFQALVRAEARTQEGAQAFLNAASTLGQDAAAQLAVTVYPAVPMSVQRVANVERAQMLVESASRAALQRFLSDWQETLHALRGTPEGQGILRWAVDVDPLAI